VHMPSNCAGACCSICEHGHRPFAVLGSAVRMRIGLSVCWGLLWYLCACVQGLFCAGACCATFAHVHARFFVPGPVVTTGTVPVRMCICFNCAGACCSSCEHGHRALCCAGVCCVPVRMRIGLSLCWGLLRLLCACAHDFYCAGACYCCCEHAHRPFPVLGPAVSCAHALSHLSRAAACCFAVSMRLSLSAVRKPPTCRRTGEHSTAHRFLSVA
jgi:hypothetical protein